MQLASIGGDRIGVILYHADICTMLSLRREQDEETALSCFEFFKVLCNFFGQSPRMYGLISSILDGRSYCAVPTGFHLVTCFHPCPICRKRNHFTMRTARWFVLVARGEKSRATHDATAIFFPFHESLGLPGGSKYLELASTWTRDAISCGGLFLLHH